METIMYAIIQSGGKQYRVEKDTVIDVELLDAEPGEHVEFDNVLFISDGSNRKVGEPLVSGYSVKAEVLGTSYAAKIVSMKYKKRKNERKKWGHRQQYTQVKILDIGGVSEKKPKEAKAEKPKKAASPAAKATPVKRTRKKATVEA